MSTYMEKKGNVVRKWYVVDAAGKPLGKTAVIVADLLRSRAVPPADAERFTTAPFPEKRYPARGCLPKPLRMQGFRWNPQRKSKTYKKKRRKLPFWGILLRFFVSFFMLTAPLPGTAAGVHFWDFQKYPWGCPPRCWGCRMRFLKSATLRKIKRHNLFFNRQWRLPLIWLT